jgi:hypothetical protein
MTVQIDCRASYQTANQSISLKRIKIEISATIRHLKVQKVIKLHTQRIENFTLLHFVPNISDRILFNCRN